MATNDFVVKNGLVVTEEAQILGTADAASSSDTNAAIYIAGGLAVAKKLHVGTDFSVGSNVTLTGDLAVNGGDITTSATTFNLVNTTATTVNFAGAATALEIGAATGTTNINNNLDVDGDVNIDGGDLTVSTLTFNLANTTATTINIGGGATDIQIGAATGTTNVNNNLDVDLDINVDGGDITTSATTFNLINGTATTVNAFGAATAIEIGAATGTTNINHNLDVDGDVNIDGGDLTVSTATFNLANANATTVNFAGAATAIEIGAATGTTNINHNLDVDGDVNIDGGDLTVSTATFNLANTNATAVNFAGAGTSIVIGAASGTTNIRHNLDVDGDVNIDGGDLTVSTSTFNLANTNATTGNLFGAGTAITIGSVTGTTTIRNANTVVTGDLAVNGADITTTSTGTATVFNTNATTVNAFGSAASIVMGAASGTTNIRHNLDVDGDVNIDGGDLTVSTTTFNLANTTATTVNFAGSGTSIVMGSATGTTNIRHNLDVDGDVNIDGGDLTVSTATFNLANTTATTGNLFGAATTLNLANTASAQTISIGNASTGASTYNLGTGATSTGNTKTVNLGTGGVTGSTTNVNIGSTISSTTTVNSGTLVGALTTQNVFNTVATVVNAFGAAGTINIGATSGTVTINNPTVVGTQTEVNLWNTTSTTVNAFGAATAVNVGANSGTATLRNPTVVGTQATVNLWNTTSTTVNAFGAATSIVMGAVTGTTNIRHNLDVDLDVNVDGGDITTSATTFNLINGTATAVNFAGAGTAITIGAATGTTNIRHNLDVDGDVNIDGGDITTSAATFNLLNGTATTVNFAGAGTAVNIGAATGTLTVGNPTLTMTNGIAFNMNGANPTIASSNTGTASIFNANITTINFGHAADINMGSTTGLVTARGRLAVSATTASTSTTTGALTVGGGAGIGGAVFVGGGVNIAGTQAAINTTTPGLTQYGLHFNGQSTADSAVGITFNGGTTAANANAGIYVQGSGAYGTKMYIATTDSYAVGSKTAISIDHTGVTNFARARPTALGNTIIDTGNISDYVKDGTLSMGVSGVGLSGSATFTANQSGASTFTVTSNATDANTASTIVARNASGNFSAGTITASLSGNATSANQVNNSVTFNNGGSGAASGTTFNGSAAQTISYNTVGAPSTSGANATGTWAIAISGNAATATNLSTNRNNWSTNGTISAVVGQLAWKNYANGHTIFDASASTSPDGGAVNNTNAAIAWSGTYPTLMGWNGSTTYGVRVDSARVADNGGVTSVSATTPIAVNQSTGAVTVSHANSGVAAGTYNNVTVNVTGHVTGGSNVAYLTGYTETDTLATVTARGSQATASMSIGTGGTYTTGSIYSDASWGMLFRARQAAPTNAEYRWATSTDVELMRLTTGGNLTIPGAFAAASKSFLIPHPTKPDMQLRYGSLEGPENGVYVRGKLVDVNVIELPDYWTGLVHADSITVNLTAAGAGQQLYVERVENNCVYIVNETGKPVDCFYTVYGERKDVDKLVVEIE